MEQSLNIRTYNLISNHAIVRRIASVRFLFGPMQRKRGPNTFASKLTDRQVRAIRHLYSTGLYTQYQLADLFGINQSQVSRIIHRHSWKHIRGGLDGTVA